MNRAYLEVTFRKGRALAAYLYLPGQTGRKSERTRRFSPGLVIDIAANGHAIGVEMTAPSRVTVASLNRALRAFGAKPVSADDLAPLSAA